MTLSYGNHRESRVSLPDLEKLLAASEVADLLQVSVRYLLETLAKLPDFPKPVRLKPRSRPRWRPDALRAWLASREGPVAKPRGRPRKVSA